MSLSIQCFLITYFFPLLRQKWPWRPCRWIKSAEMFSSDLARRPGFAEFLSGQREPFLPSPAVSALLSLQAQFSQGYGLKWGDGGWEESLGGILGGSQRHRWGSLKCNQNPIPSDYHRQNSRTWRGFLLPTLHQFFFFFSIKEWAAVHLRASILPWGRWFMCGCSPEYTASQTILQGLCSCAQPITVGSFSCKSQAPSVKGSCLPMTEE